MGTNSVTPTRHPYTLRSIPSVSDRANLIVEAENPFEFVDFTRLEPCYNAARL